MLLEEAAGAAGKSGPAFEGASVLGSLLSGDRSSFHNTAFCLGHLLAIAMYLLTYMLTMAAAAGQPSNMLDSLQCTFVSSV